MPAPPESKLTKEDQILINTSKSCEALTDIKKTNERQFFALVGVIMALIGQKLISTPWYVDLAVILCLISGTFLLMSAVFWWKYYNHPQRATRITGSALLLVSAISQIWIYHPGMEAAPPWFAPVINGLMILLACSMMWAGWTQKPKNGHNLC
jgi:hypothetical protein